MDFLDQLRIKNNQRQNLWDPENLVTPLFRSNEMGGEAGEVLNVVKKLERERMGIRGSRDTVEHLAEEIADVIICLDLLAEMYGINIQQAVKDKFNATSTNVGFLVFIE